MTRPAVLAAALALTCLAAEANAVKCRDLHHAGTGYTVCSVDPASEDLRLFRADAEGAPYGHFAALDTALAKAGQRLSFAMNGGMYHGDRGPVGHYIEDSTEQMRVIASEGPGNFGLLPNGVLCITDTTAQVYETSAYLAAAPSCRHATQSGPMLVIDGALHPDFLPDSTSRYIRNGVGTTATGDGAVFVISNASVTFWEFASLFRDVLHLPNALFLDGNVSRLHAPDLGRSDPGFAMGPIVGVVERAP